MRSKDFKHVSDRECKTIDKLGDSTRKQIACQIKDGTAGLIIHEKLHDKGKRRQKKLQLSLRNWHCICTQGRMLSEEPGQDRVGICRLQLAAKAILQCHSMWPPGSQQNRGGQGKASPQKAPPNLGRADRPGDPQSSGCCMRVLEDKEAEGALETREAPTDDEAWRRCDGDMGFCHSAVMCGLCGACSALAGCSRSKAIADAPADERARRAAR